MSSIIEQIKVLIAANKQYLITGAVGFVAGVILANVIK